MPRVVILSRRDITHPLSGGAGRYVHEIFRRLTSRYSVTVLAEGGPTRKSVEEIDGITYRHFPGALHRMLLPTRYITKFAGNTDLLVDNADVGIPWFSPFYCRKPRITIVHQLVREIFYDELPRPLSDLGYALEPLLYRLYSASRIVAASKSTARDLQYCGISEKNINVVSPGCANPGLGRTPLTDRLPKTIGCVSRLMKYKGLQLALKAFSKVVSRSPDAKLLVAGSGPYKQELAKMALDLGISTNVEFLGRVSEGSKFKLYGETRVAISPSHREGFGISVIEANSVGTPVVGWDVPGSRDSIVDGATGLLAPFPDDTAFADRIFMLLTDDRTWLNFSDSALKWARDHSWDKSAKDFENVMESTLAGR